MRARAEGRVEDFRTKLALHLLDMREGGIRCHIDLVAAAALVEEYPGPRPGWRSLSQVRKEGRKEGGKEGWRDGQ